MDIITVFCMGATVGVILALLIGPSPKKPKFEYACKIQAGSKGIYLFKIYDETGKFVCIQGMAAKRTRSEAIKAASRLAQAGFVFDLKED